MKATRSRSSVYSLLGLLGVIACGPVPPCPRSVAPPPPPPLILSPPESVKTQPVAPKSGEPFAVTRRQNYRMEFGAYALEIDPVDGGRILEFSLHGQNIIVTVKESPEANGSSIWTSPQSDWNWPPPPELDRLPWKVTLEPKALLLESETSVALGLQVKQRFTPEPETGSLRIDYEFINRGTSPRKLAPWQNTRVRPRSLLFYPANSPTYAFAENTLPLKPENGITWYQHEPEKLLKDSLKSYGNGEEGWFANVDGRLLFIKQFENVKLEEQPPKEGEIVLYVDRKGHFVEMEQQGSYLSIAPGTSRHYAVRWFLRQLPDTIAVEKGNPALVNYVREQLLQARSATLDIAKH